MNTQIKVTTFANLKKDYSLESLVFNPLPKSDDASPDSKDFLWNQELSLMMEKGLGIKADDKILLKEKTSEKGNVYYRVYPAPVLQEGGESY